MQNSTSTNLDYESDTCPYCGAKREPELLQYGERTTYKQCRCDESQKAVKERGEFINHVKDIEDTIYSIDLEIKATANTAQRLLAESNLGDRFKERTFENFDRKVFPAIYDKALQYAKGFETGLEKAPMFVGNPGTGKTHLAAAITNYIIGIYGVPVKFGSFVSILESIRRGYGENEDRIEELITVPLLVLDDLGKEKNTDWAKEKLYEVVNARYENNLPIVVTSNESLPRLSEHVGEATVSRLAEMCEILMMNGKDYRFKK